MNRTLTNAAGLGAVAGLRSMMAPALLTQAARTGSIALGGTPFEFLSTPRAADIATAAAALELVGDKLPFTPARVKPVPLLARAASGAMVGAALCAAGKKDIVAGAVAGGVAAIAAAFGGYVLRRALTQHSVAPDFVVALAEDAIAVSAGVLILRAEA